MMDYNNDNYSGLPSNRKFGFFLTFIFAVVTSYWLFYESVWLSYGFGIVSLIFLAVTLTHAEILNPLNKLWMSLGFLMGKLVNPIVVGIIFFCLFTPIGFFMRIFGRDILQLEIKNKDSYWRDRNQVDGINESFKNQF